MRTSTLSFNTLPEELKVWISIFIATTPDLSLLVKLGMQGSVDRYKRGTTAMGLFLFNNKLTSDQQDAVLEVFDWMNHVVETDKVAYNTFFRDARSYYHENPQLVLQTLDTKLNTRSTQFKLSTI